jgi:hypothetical protein
MTRRQRSAASDSPVMGMLSAVTLIVSSAAAHLDLLCFDSKPGKSKFYKPRSGKLLQFAG